MTKKLVTEDGEVIQQPATPEEIARQIQKTETLFFKTPFNHDTDIEAKRTALTCRDPSRTQQQFADEADINNILAKFARTQDPSLLNPKGTPNYLNIEEEYDLMDKMVTAAQVEAEWEKLPKQARAILGTPKRFLEWYDRCLETGDIQGLADIGLVDLAKYQKRPDKAHDAPKPPPGDTPAPDGEKPGDAPTGAPAT